VPKVVPGSISKGLDYLKAVFKMKAAMPVDAQFNVFQFSLDKASGCSGLIYQSRNGYSN
jgi:hypothetical protein